jgi:Repeat of unknown function (DUF5648)
MCIFRSWFEYSIRGLTTWRRAAFAAIAALNMAGLSLAQNASVIEYYLPSIDAYFMTGRAADQALVESYPALFRRTGAQFAAIAPNAAAAPFVRVCRFYISLATPFVNNHFYGKENDDCAFLLGLNLQGFTYEGFDFAIQAPDANGGCPASAPFPIFRSFRPIANGRTSNHRYTSSRAEYDAMTASGWTPEGVTFCSASVASATAINRTSFKRTVSSQRSPFAAGCDGVATGNSVLNVGAEVEPMIARNPSNDDHLIASWQQDRWSNGGAAGLGGAASFDGGLTWSNHYLPFSRCGGGTAGNGGDFARATDPWSTIAPDGTAYQMALTFSGESFTANSDSAMRVARSLDGGRTWGSITTLVRDVGADIFHDKNMMIADPTDARYAYAVWGRLQADNSGPAWFSRTIDRGNSWENARSIYDPGRGNQTLGNQIVVMPNGTLVNSFSEIERGPGGGTTSVRVRVIRSIDKGLSWSTPTTVADLQSVGTVDPETRAAVRDGSGIPALAASADNELHLVWQDARFNAGRYDGIVYAKSSDGGLTWSQPVRVNARTDVPAFAPTVNVRADGVIGVAYYDFRANTTSAGDLPTTLRLATSREGTSWTEAEIEAPFNLNTAPVARGYFLGDYIGLTSRRGAFEAFYARSTGSAPDNRTEAVFASVAEGMLKHKNAFAESPDATPSIAVAMTDELRQRIHRNIDHVIAARLNR